MTLAQELSVGEVARRSGLAVSTLHFYESKGLIASRRTGGNQRRYMRGVLRRIAVIRIAQRAGIPLEEIRQTFAAIPLDRAPTVREWERAMRAWTETLEQRINDLTDLRDKLFNCIGCGCLSVTDCPLRNCDDKLGAQGPGPRILITAAERRARRKLQG
ncbi:MULTISPECIES: redox-sensitive transcriptional activator SoxR [Bradyrhizobium]|jgi:MerR family transcriptional regulator, redox-sensitive transcriptional activator SoxR|uniref:redox-sensitive transcriptional activator SoxR n=1 Tax=Bradyrhizobium TaxID=374 RepID=UPI000484391A|nr:MULTISPECIES: redox-sensitive transcriptional activator SoxR [Bradyrhizobium]MCS3450755.1 MerR family redox-sensitive transcriptional activator SoxR [Bradyrhizobium elkanii]MCS3558100.1 MerR family redox-sensitive transcriptional activator SoxR [Bradyrhizobium elkanii]MCW2152053.1 MerR family redox-sensitive transcriptional activator SoxR [Bradyrhizobium elkanii]MCW2358071.1 MerR family redox-sensitive transcriptional activator SoxR [Bradyrhizobium elkanii]MCW2375784.1 MerR family redox-sen